METLELVMPGSSLVALRESAASKNWWNSEVKRSVPACSSCCVAVASVLLKNASLAHAASASQNNHRQTQRISHGIIASHTKHTKDVRSTFPIVRTTCQQALRMKTLHGSVCGIFASYSLVKRKGVLHSSQCFLCVRESQSIRHCWCTNLMLPEHLQG